MKIILISCTDSQASALFIAQLKEIFKVKYSYIRTLFTSDYAEYENMALTLGWDGVKDARGGKLLYDLKKTFESYCDSTRSTVNTITALKDEYDIVFIYMISDSYVDYICNTNKALLLYLVTPNTDGSRKLIETQPDYIFIRGLDTISSFVEKLI